LLVYAQTDKDDVIKSMTQELVDLKQVRGRLSSAWRCRASAPSPLQARLRSCM